MRGDRLAILACACMAVLCGGCSTSASMDLQRASTDIHPGLVLAMDDLDEGQFVGLPDEASWITHRNDSSMGSRDIPIARIEYLTERHREFLRTTNGRPREYTTTSRFSVRHDVRP